MRVIRSIIADLRYMIGNVREFGFSVRGIKADLAYMYENIVDPTRERVQ